MNRILYGLLVTVMAKRQAMSEGAPSRGNRSAEDDSDGVDHGSAHQQTRDTPLERLFLPSKHSPKNRRLSLHTRFTSGAQGEGIAETSLYVTSSARTTRSLANRRWARVPPHDRSRRVQNLRNCKGLFTEGLDTFSFSGIRYNALQISAREF